MPTRDQVAFHNQQEQQKRTQEAALAQQSQQQQALQGYQAQSGLLAQQHAYGQQSAEQQFQHQGALQIQGVDLQARFNQVKRNQDEEMRRVRMEKARASVEDNPDLSQYERHNLITQIESGLNPLENRQREQQMLTAHLQQQAISQQNDQQATLFNQRQERVAAGAGGRTQVLTDPLTGRQQLFMMDLNGEFHPLDFSQSQTMHEAQLQHLQATTQATAQQTEQQGQMFPGQLQRQDLGNQQLAQTMQFAREIHPLDVQRGTQANTLMAQQIEQNPQTFNLNQLQGYAHLGGLQQQLQERIQAQPHNLSLLSANAQIAQARAAAEPTNTSLQQEAQRANIQHTNAITEHTNAIVERMPSVQQAAQQHGAQSQHAEDTATIARVQLQRLQAGGVPDSMARDIVDHAIGGIDREIAHAEQDAQRTALLGGTEAEHARGRLESLRSNRSRAISQRTAEAEDLMRRVTGMPAVNRPAPPPEAPAQNNNAVFENMDRQVAAMPAAQRQVAQPAVARLRAIRQAFPGGFGTMPADIQREVMQLIERVRNVAPAPQGPGPAAPGILQRVNEAFGGG